MTSLESFVVGAFGSEDKARAACQAEADSTAEAWGAYGKRASALAWEDAEATTDAGDHYAVVLVDLDVPVS